MSTLKELADNCRNTNFQKIYKIIDKSVGTTMKFAADGTPVSPASHSTGDIEEIKSHLYNEVQANTIAAHGGFTTFNEVKSSVNLNMKKVIAGITKDGFYNPMSGVGTSIDPGMNNQTYQPLLMGPGEVTSLYANGGVASAIIDKKAKGAVLNGYTILSNRFHAQELQELKEHAESKGFADACCSAGLRDGYVYGGAATYPILKLDTPVTTAMTVRQLINEHLIGKNCLSHFVEVDRWNTVVIPSYDLSTEDYLRPRSFYVPISGLEVNAERSAYIKPKPQPYWAAIRQLGWGEPDSVGYLRSLLSYNILIMAVPIMAQQMSLVVHRLPLDGIIAMNGPAAAKKWQAENEKELRDWSMFNPKAINAYGEIDVLNRTYTGFGELVDTLRKDISANCSLPESVIFYTQPSGIFNKTEEDVLLKQSETIKMGQKAVTPELNKLLPILAADLWGLPEGMASWEKYQTLQLSFDTPVVSSPSEKAEILRKFSESISLLHGAGMATETALAYAKRYLGEVEVPKDIEEKLTSIPQVVAPEQVDENVSGADNTAPTAEGSADVVAPDAETPVVDHTDNKLKGDANAQNA